MTDKDPASPEMQRALDKVANAIDEAILSGVSPVGIYGNLVDRAVAGLMLAVLRTGCDSEKAAEIIERAVQNGIDFCVARLHMEELDIKKKSIH